MHGTVKFWVNNLQIATVWRDFHGCCHSPRDRAGLKEMSFWQELILARELSYEKSDTCIMWYRSVSCPRTYKNCCHCPVWPFNSSPIVPFSILFFNILHCEPDFSSRNEALGAGFNEWGLCLTHLRHVNSPKISLEWFIQVSYQSQLFIFCWSCIIWFPAKCKWPAVTHFQNEPLNEHV